MTDERRERFERLSPDLTFEAVDDALAGPRCTGRAFPLNSYENRVYQFELDDDSWVIGKFYRPHRWTREAILEEHAFTMEVHEQEIPVAMPRKLSSGTTLSQVDDILFALFDRVYGRPPHEFDDEQLKVVGRLLARIHNTGATRPSEHRMHLTPETYGSDNLDYLFDNEVLPEDVEENYMATAEVLIERIEPMFDGVPTHRIHGDCHLGNLLWTEGGPAFLDFDDMVMGPAVQDVWMLVASADDEGRRQRDVLLEAYEQFRPFDETWLRLVEPLRALRYIHYAAWITRRWSDPLFKRTFEFFGTVRYWQNELQDLREQIARIDALP
jgi:Ser/Thr protein kinase RdoA (MazF antagonist)